MFETLSQAKKLDKAKELFVQAVDADMEWQREAMEDFDFRDGNQWTKKEKEVLEKELRPALTFNMTKSSVDLIMGLNEDNRIIFRCTPQEMSDDFLCEVMNNIYDWVRENNEFEDEEDMALESAAIAGRGYVAMDFVPDPKRFGDIVMQEVVVPVHEIHFDPAARRTDLSDASYITWDRWLSVEEFAVKFPKYSAKRIEEFIQTGRSYIMGSSAQGHQDAFERDMEGTSDNSDYSTPLDTTYFDRGRRMVRLVHMEYWETFKRYFGFNPETKGFEEFDGKNLKKIKEAFQSKFNMEFQYETLMDKRVKWLQFIGTEVLYDGLSPLPFDGFSIVPMFAFRDVSQRSANHFGIVRLMKDPQREINKRWSQALNLLNQSSQPGVFVEVDAFLDLEQALLSMKDPGSATLLNSGGMNKFQERSMPAFPAAPMQMEEYSQEIMRKITGINPDLLGQDRGRQEPGVVVRLRQQQGMVLMKPLFKSFNKLRKALFKRSLAIIMEYMPNEQIMKILGENGRYAMDQKGNIMDRESGLTANLRDLKNIEYNIKSEEAPGNMTKRTLELTSFLEMQKTGFPVEPSVVINRLDLPASEKKKWLEYINAQQQSQQQMAEQQMAQEQENKNRELTLEEKKVILEFIIDSAKVNQQAEKDEKKLATSAAQIEQSSNAAILSFLSSIMQKKEEGGSSDGKQDQERKASAQRK
jgi:hypothetical protein